MNQVQEEEAIDAMETENMESELVPEVSEKVAEVSSYEDAIEKEDIVPTSPAEPEIVGKKGLSDTDSEKSELPLKIDEENSTKGSEKFSPTGEVNLAVVSPDDFDEIEILEINSPREQEQNSEKSSQDSDILFSCHIGKIECKEEREEKEKKNDLETGQTVTEIVKSGEN